MHTPMRPLVFSARAVFEATGQCRMLSKSSFIKSGRLELEIPLPAQDILLSLAVTKSLESGIFSTAEVSMSVSSMASLKSRS